LVHGNPLGCDPEKTDCILDSESVDCPERPEGSGIGNCHKYSMEVNSAEEYVDSVNSIATKASLACVSFSQDDTEDAICHSETAPISIAIAQHFRTFESNKNYNQYLESCYDANAEACFMSMSVKMEGAVGFFNLELVADYNDYPTCLPGVCSEDEKITMISQLISDDVGTRMQKGLEDGLRRKLRSDFGYEETEDFFARVLQRNDLCPAIGMDICDFQVMDFYCIERGKETGPLSMGGGSSDAATHAMTMESFVMAIGVALTLGILL